MTEDVQFGVGAGTCIGNDVFLLELSKVLLRLLREFDLTIATGSERETPSGWFVKPKLEVCVSKWQPEMDTA